MKNNLLMIPVLLIVLFAAASAATGIFSNNEEGPYTYTSIRGKSVAIYGKGIYKHMSADVAPQGIAQDYVTLFLALPLLLVAYFGSRSGSVRFQLFLCGTLGYLFITYLFYMCMGMYNQLFLAYVCLTSLSFFSMITVMLSINQHQLSRSFTRKAPYKLVGSFLIFTSIAIGFLWLSIVVPPLLDGTIVPIEVQHYTTLIVQGMDLALLLPAAFISAILFIQQKPLGLLLCPVYFVFLTILMTALTAKVIAMAVLGINVIPVIFIIPAFNIISLLCTIAIFRNIRAGRTVLDVGVLTYSFKTSAVH